MSFEKNTYAWVPLGRYCFGLSVVKMFQSSPGDSNMQPKFRTSDLIDAELGVTLPDDSPLGLLVC